MVKKQLIVKQVDLQDCGPCCVLSILKYYKGYIPLEQIKIDTFVTLKGTTAYHLVNAFRKYGFDASGKKITLKDLQNEKLPVIAHLELENSYKHYVVIYSVDFVKEKIIVMDPAIGIKEYSFNDFLKIWSNIIISVYPNSTIIKLPKDSSLRRMIISLLNSEKDNILKLIAISSSLSIVTIIASFYFKVILNNTSNSIDCLKWLIILYFIISLLKVILGYLRDYYESYLDKNIDVKLMLAFLNHIFKLPLDIVNNKTTGEILTRISQINNIKDLFTKCFVTIFLDLLLVIISAIILYNISSKLFLLLLVVCVIYIIIGIALNVMLYPKIARNIELESNFNTCITERVDSFLTIKSINKLPYILRQIENKYCMYLQDNFNFSIFLINGNLAKDLVYSLGCCLITSLGCLLIYHNNLSIVDLIMFNTLLIYLFDPIKNFINLMPRVNYIRASMQKISEFIGLEEEKTSGIYQTFVNGNISFENISYSYNKYNYIYKNFNLKIPMGSKVMIKGPSGCGKSTICKLLYRLYNYDGGIIKIGNINIMDYDLEVLRKNVTYLAQNEKIFSDTIYNNIVVGQEITTYMFNYIARICTLDKIVDKKALRYETIITPGGNLSGGEIQRILLARALVKNANILILDEALSEVDEALEKKILKSVISAFEQKTIIYVSHRNNEELFNQVIRFG